MHRIKRLGIVVGVALFAAILWRLDWPIFFQSLVQVDGVWVLLCFALLSLGVAGRALRWEVIATGNICEFFDFWRATQLGYLTNMLYPARAGEIIRVVAIGRFTGLVPGKAVGSALVDRLLDGLTLSILLAGIVVFAKLDHMWRNLVLIMMAGTGLVIFALVVFVFLGADRVLSWPIMSCLRPWIAQAIEVLQELRNWHRLGFILLLHVVTFFLDFFTYFALLQGFGWALPFQAAVLLKVMMTAASSLPSTPGYLGVYQLAAIVGLGFYGVGESEAVAFSLLWQVVQLSVFGTQGGFGCVSLIFAKEDSGVL